MQVSPRLARSARVALVVVIAAYGTLLRLDAISQQYDLVSSPRWLHWLENARNGPSRLRPAAMAWAPAPRFAHRDGPPTQYRSDPYSYLEYARAMRSFYAAHRREPIFPFATKVWLWLLHDHDTAVSFASAGFAVGAIVLTVLIGAEAFSFSVGAAAAALWAIEFDAVSWSTAGWRDDAFTAMLLLTTWLALRYIRQPSPPRAALMGVAGGLACLVRLTSPTFVVPLFVALVIAPGRPTRGWRARLGDVGLAVAMTLLVAGPFLFNCWRVYGDPFFSIDALASIVRTAEGKDEAQPSSMPSYLGERLHARPIEVFDSVALGVTVYPFANKWTGFDPWSRHLGTALAAAALAGLVLFTVLPQGRWLLLIGVTALVPFSLTWRVFSDWRFTQAAYPFLLIAACAVPWAIVTVIRSPRPLRSDPRLRTAIAIAASALLVAAGVWFVLTRVTPPLIFEESLRAGEPATLMAGDRDAVFVTSDWPQLVRGGPVPTRATRAPRASILLPLPRPADYDLLMRIDPCAEPLRAGAVPQQIDLTLNGRYVGVCDSGSTPDRVGVCRLRLPAEDVRPGTNRLTVSTAQPAGFRFWYVRVTPAAR